MNEPVENVINNVFDMCRDWLNHYEELKGDKWFRRKWITPEIEKSYNFENKDLIFKLAKDMYYAGYDGTLDAKPDFKDLSFNESVLWITKAMVIINKYNISEKIEKE